MRIMWKIGALLLSIALLRCEEHLHQQKPETHDQDPCDLLITRITMCIGGVPVLVGECNPESAQFILDLPCEDILDELGVG